MKLPENFDLLSESNKGPVLLKFSAAWCGPCKMLAPIVAKVAAERGLTVIDIDIDENQDMTTTHQVRGVPTLKLFHKGEERARLVGAATNAQVQKFLTDNLEAA